MSQATTAYAPRDEPSYHDFLASLQNHFEQQLAAIPRLFTTSSIEQPVIDDNLFDLFLSHLPASDKQFYTCHACRRFVNTYGGLVSIDAEGNTASVMWNETRVPPFFHGPVRALRNYVERARVNGVFVTADKVWGTPVTGTWTHMAIKPHSGLLYTGKVKTAGQIMAERKEDYRVMVEALHLFPASAIETAVGVLRTDVLYRSEKVLGVAEWLKALHDARERTSRHRQQDNILWRAVASAPAGYCHPRSSMIGVLLDDILAGLPIDVMVNRFKAYMHGLQYQRPQVAPGAQNIKRAEEIVAKLGIAESLKRRYARFDEIKTIWTPKSKPVSKRGGETTGVFKDVAAKTAAPLTTKDNIQMPITTITVEKFRRTVLPDALSIEFWVPSQKASYVALTTAEDANAPPILQWDHEDARNPVSSYVYDGGSTAAAWGLTAVTLCKVNAVTLYPAMWQADKHLPHMGESIIMILDGARDSAYRTAGAGLFPEILKADLREVSATIEAFSKKSMITGYEESSACGLVLVKNAKVGHRFRVTTSTTTTDYELDRWD